MREVTLHDPAQPFYLEGYHRPSYLDKDDAVYDAISDIMSNGRTSRLYRSLVRDQKIAAFAAGFSGLPGDKYGHLFAFYAVPLPGHSNQELQKAVHQEIDKLKSQDVSDDELQMFKTRTKADLLRGLASNEGLAQQLATYQTLLWRLARAVPLSRSRGQGHQGRHPSRRQPGISGKQPDRRPYRNSQRPTRSTGQQRSGAAMSMHKKSSPVSAAIQRRAPRPW